MKQLEERTSVFTGHSYTDFAYHFILAGEVPPNIIGEIGEAIQAGVASFKIFTTFDARCPYGHATFGLSSRRWRRMEASWPSTPKTTISSTI